MPNSTPPHRRFGDDEIAFREPEMGMSEPMLRAILRASEDGILLTDLDHRSLACNRRFGEYFGIPSQEVVTSEVEELRRRVLPLIAEPDKWLRSLDLIYADPERVLHDELVLIRNSKIVLRRYSAPVTAPNGQIVGRLWSFRDVTEDWRRQEVHRVLGETVSHGDVDPQTICHRIMEAVSEFFDNTTAILSIRHDDNLVFRDVVGPKSILTEIAGNRMKDSFCQFAIRDVRTLLIQDAKSEPQFRKIRPARSGFTRYLGAPVVDESGEPIGTICLLDRRSDRPLGLSDIQLMSLVAMRISAELARERRTQERIAAAHEDLQRRQRELLQTQRVFEAMNSAIALLAQCPELDSLLREQTKLLNGIFKNEAAAVMLRRSGRPQFHGFAGRSRPTAVTQTLSEFSEPFGLVSDAGHPMAKRLRATGFAYAKRQQADVGEIAVFIGAERGHFCDERRRVHLEALAEQILLVVEAQLLQSQLVEKNEQLLKTQEELLRSEKLSVAGTLAAVTAHDIRNITASLALLASPGFESPDVALASVREQCSRFDVLAHRLLSYARPREFELRPVDIRELSENVLKLTAAQIRVSRVEVTNRIPLSLPLLHGDPHQLEHLFVNLVLNAVQAMERTGGGTLTLHGKSNHDEVVVRVVDSGPGLTRDAIPSLFEPFRSTRANGFGLGLYSCRRISEMHGGGITASRNPVRGSTFTVTLPVGGPCQQRF